MAIFPEQSTHRPEFALGKHITVEYYDCDSTILAQSDRMEEIFIAAAKASGATVLGSHFHSFQPQGVSGFVIIAESHFSVHAWPEHDYAAVDIFTCGESISFETAVNFLRDAMRSQGMVISGVMNRGIVANDGMMRAVPSFAGDVQDYQMSWRRSFDCSNAWAISAMLDVYNVKIDDYNDRNFWIGLLKKCADFLGVKNGNSVVFNNIQDAEKGDGFGFVQTFDHGSMLTGRVLPGVDTVFFEVFCVYFFEPREFSELVVSALSGNRYRLQVGIRR